MERSRIDFLLERVIWLLVLAVLIVGPLTTGLVRPEDFVYVLGLTVTAVGVWILRIWFSPDHRVLFPPICYVVVAFVGYAAWCYTRAPVEYIARQEFLKVMVYGAIFLVFVSNLHRQDATQLVSVGFIVLAMLISFYAAYQFLTRSEQVWNFTRPHGYEGRASGTYINPNHLAGFLEMILPLAVALVMAGRFSILSKVLFGYAALVILVGLGLTVSRAGWGAAGVGMLFLLAVYLAVFSEQWMPAVVTGVVLLLAGVALYAVARKADSQNRLTSLRSSYDVRYRIWPAAVAVWEENVWFGGGPDHFDRRYRKYRPASDQLVGRPGRVHNDYLNTLADWGLVGLGLVGSALLCLGWGMIRSWKYLQRSANELGGSRQSTRAATALGATAGLVAILAHSVYDFNMHIPANALTAVALMALVTTFLRYSTERYWLSGAWWMRILVGLPLVGWLVVMVPWGRQLYDESQDLAAAYRIKEYSPTRLELLKRAFARDEKNPRTAYEIGEHFWKESSDGAEGYEVKAKEAMSWFERARQLDPFDPGPLIRYGMCLDWLDRKGEALDYFQRALALDPNGFNTVAHMGWHFFQLENYVEAKKWFEKSVALYWHENPLSYSYLKIIEKKLAERAPAKP